MSTVAVQRRGRWCAAAHLSTVSLAVAFALALVLWPARFAVAQTSLVVASPESASTLFKELDPAFIASAKKSTGRDVRVEQKAGTPVAQSKALRDGLAADVVALGDAGALDALAQEGVLATEWRKQFPSEAAPWATTVVFVVREGNPKGIRNWRDLSKAGVRVVLPDPQTDAVGRYGWLGGWGAVKKSGGSDAQAERFASGLLKNAAPLAANSSAAIEAFARQGAGDVLIAFESQVPAIEQTALEEKRKVRAIVPSTSILVPQPVAVVPGTTRKKGTGELAKAYLNFMYSEPAQQIAAMRSWRPASKGMLKIHAARFKPVKLFTAADLFGSLAEAERIHFAAGGRFERLRNAGK